MPSTDEAWMRSSVPQPMTCLEYDVLAGPYSSGYGVALSAILGAPVRVLNHQHNGHLYSTLAHGHPVSSADHPRGPQLWESTVLPLMRKHFTEMTSLAQDHRQAGRLAELFQENVLLHHLMLLPARQRIARFTRSIGEGLGTGPTDQEATALAVLDVTTSRDLPALTYLTSPPTPDSDRDRLARAAPDGDGYGLAAPGWLDDDSYLTRFSELLTRFDITDATIKALETRSLERASAIRSELESRARGTQIAPVVAHLADIARQSAVIEQHGPLMHVQHMALMRRTVRAWGTALAAAGRIEEPDQIFHLHLHELTQDTWDRRQLGQRQLQHTAYETKTLPPPALHRPLPPGETPLDHATRHRLENLLEPSGLPPVGDGWIGIPAASGTAKGRLIHLHSQGEIGQLHPGDIAAVPDAGAAWGWLAVAGIPIVVAHGSRLGHASAAARVAGVPCIIAARQPPDDIPYGAAVTMSGDTGRIDW